MASLTEVLFITNMTSPWITPFTSFQQSWSEICSAYPPSVIEFVFTTGVQFLSFWVPAIIYLSIDLLFPEFSNRHKIQSERRQPSWEQIKQCIKYVALNELVGIAIQAVLRSAFGWDKTLFTISRDLPSIRTILFDFVYGLLCREVIFYYVHRAFHHPSIYPYIHKKHHKFTTPMAFAAQYAHPVEHVLANMLPIFLPMAIKRSHLLSFCVFEAVELWEAAADHSGYDFVKLPPAEIHDLHHEKFRVNYSPLGLMDWIHGTDMLGWDKKPKKA